MITIIIKHRRVASAFTTVTGSKKEKKQGHIAYLLSPKPNKGERPALGVRVGKYWGQLPNGMQPTGEPETDAALLLSTSNTEGRNQLLEFLITCEPQPTTELQREAEKVAEEVAENLMRTFFPDRPWLACRHGDRAHAHVHMSTPNADNKGHAIRIDGRTFNKIRREIERWSRGRARSGWGKGKLRERELAEKTDEDLQRLIAEGKLTIRNRAKKGPRKDKIDTLDYHYQSEDEKHPLKAMVRWWKLAGLLKTRANWLELQILLSVEQNRIQQNRDEIRRIKFREKAQELVLAYSMPGPAR